MTLPFALERKSELLPDTFDLSSVALGSISVLLFVLQNICFMSLSLSLLFFYYWPLDLLLHSFHLTVISTSFLSPFIFYSYVLHLTPHHVASAKCSDSN